MLLTPDLHDATHFEKRLTLALGPDVLTPTYSYLSQTERSEYTTTSEQYGKDILVGEQGMTEGSEEYEAALKEFDERMKHYLQHRLYPVLPDWPRSVFTRCPSAARQAITTIGIPLIMPHVPSS